MLFYTIMWKYWLDSCPADQHRQKKVIAEEAGFPQSE